MIQVYPHHTGQGLDPSDCCELGRKIIDLEDWDRVEYPYRVGSFCMAKEELVVLKQAFLELKPDGFYWSPPERWRTDALEPMKQSDRCSANMWGMGTRVVSEEVRQQWDNYTVSRIDSPLTRLYYGILFCDSIQTNKAYTNTAYTIADMVVISKDAISL
jgi:hypothetical protein